MDESRSIFWNSVRQISERRRREVQIKPASDIIIRATGSMASSTKKTTSNTIADIGRGIDLGQPNAQRDWRDKRLDLSQRGAIIDAK
jgi:hypothetical protein